MEKEAQAVSRSCAECRYLSGLLERACGYLEYGDSELAVETLQKAFRKSILIGPQIYWTAERISAASRAGNLAEEGLVGPCSIQLSSPVCSYESPSIFACSFDFPPLLKTNSSGPGVAEILGLEIEKAVSLVTSEKDHRFKDVVVIFVNRVAPGELERQPYFDNDNLLIKRLLDSIISFVAFDDCANYCSNIYTTEESDSSGFAIYVVEKGHLIEWLHTHSGSKFAQEFDIIFPSEEGQKN